MPPHDSASLLRQARQHLARHHCDLRVIVAQQRLNIAPSLSNASPTTTNFAKVPQPGPNPLRIATSQMHAIRGDIESRRRSDRGDEIGEPLDQSPYPHATKGTAGETHLFRNDDG